jgi:hypothetical protein
MSGSLLAVAVAVAVGRGQQAAPVVEALVALRRSPRSRWALLPTRSPSEVAAVPVAAAVITEVTAAMERPARWRSQEVARCQLLLAAAVATYGEMEPTVVRVVVVEEYLATAAPTMEKAAAVPLGKETTAATA